MCKRGRIIRLDPVLILPAFSLALEWGVIINALLNNK